MDDNSAEGCWPASLVTHDDVDAADQLSGKRQAGESDPEELTCCGLSYLARLGSESW